MDRKKMKARRISRDDQGKPNKEEYAVAKCLKFNAPYKEGKFEGNNVHYFMGSKIVDFLLESQWSSKKSKSNPLFTTRSSCTAYCSRLLSKGFFCRVEKQEKKKKEAEKVSLKDEIGGVIKRSKSKREKCKKTEDEIEISKAGDQSGEDKPLDQAKDDSSNEDKKKKKKTPRLNFHSDQKFIDGQDLYVWLYDPVPVKTFVIGLLLVVGAIAVCLFPLWPPEIKLGIYYLSCAAFGFIGLILSLCVVRLIVFVLVWLFSMGDVSIWLLPNLTEDVGFVDSFKPLYKISYGSQIKEKSKIAKNEKDSDFPSEVKTGNEDEDEEDEQKNDDDNDEDENDGVKEQLGDTKEVNDCEGNEEEEEDGNESYEVIDADEDEEASVKIDGDDDDVDDDDDDDNNDADLVGDDDGKSDKKND